MVTKENQISCTAGCRRTDVFKNITLEELEHIASCDVCAESYANAIEQQAMITAPHYLKKNILQKSGAFSVMDNSIYKKLPMSWKRFQLFTYSMKIGLAMCGALALLNLVSPGNIPGRQPSGVVSFMDKMNDELRAFSDNILEYTDFLVSSNNKNNKEDIKHDKKKE